MNLLFHLRDSLTVFCRYPERFCPRDHLAEGVGGDLLRKIRFVYQKRDISPPVSVDYVAILLCEGSAPVKEYYDYIGSFRLLPDTGDSLALNFFPALPDPRRVDEFDRQPFYENSLFNKVPRRARSRCDDDPIFSEEPVQKARLSHVRFSRYDGGDTFPVNFPLPVCGEDALHINNNMANLFRNVESHYCWVSKRTLPPVHHRLHYHIPLYDSLSHRLSPNLEVEMYQNALQN